MYVPPVIFSPPAQLVEQRLDLYHHCIESVRAKYTHICVPIDGDREPDEVFEDIANVIMARAGRYTDSGVLLKSCPQWCN